MPPIDVWPNPLSAERRYAVLAKPGDTLADAVDDSRLVDAVAVVDGELVPMAEWGRVVLRDGQAVQVRAVVHGDDSNPLQAVALIAVLVAAAYAGPAVAGFLGFAKGTTAFNLAASIATASIATVGSLAVNAIFPPRLPDEPGTSQPPDQFSLTGGRNRPRPHEPLMLVLGTHRVYPDLAALEFTEFGTSGAQQQIEPTTAPDLTEFYGPGGAYSGQYAGTVPVVPQTDRQYLNQIFDFGIGDLDVSALKIGDAAVSTFQGVSLQSDLAGLGASPLADDKVTLFAGNVDSVGGADLEHDAWQEFASPAKTTSFAVDVACQHFHVDEDSGDVVGLLTDFEFQWRYAGGSWPEAGSAANRHTFTVRSRSGRAGRNPRRISVYIGKVAGAAHSATFDGRALEIRVRRTTPDPDENSRFAMHAGVVAVRYMQDAEADFAGRNALAMRVEATGQLYGQLDQINAIASQKVQTLDADDNWTSEKTASSNPAAVFRALLSGIRHGTVLQAGLGLAASRIDETGLAAWYRFCERHSLECNLVLTRRMDDAALLTLVAQCGWASISQATGKWGVVYEDEAKAVSAVYTPANIVAGSMQVSYDNEGLADEISGVFADRDSEYEENELKRIVPNAGTPDNPVTVPLRGITDGEQAAKELNRMAAAQFYHQRVLRWRVPPEGLVTVRGDKVVLAHGLVGGAVGGRMLRKAAVAGRAWWVFLSPVALPYDDTNRPDNRIWLWDANGNVESGTYRTRSSVNASGRRAIDAALGITTDAERARAYRVDGIADLPPGDAMALKFMSYHGGAGEHEAIVTGVVPTPDGGFDLFARDEVAAYYAARTSDLTHPLIAAKQRIPVIRDVHVSDYLRTAVGDVAQEVVIDVILEVNGAFTRGFIQVATVEDGEAGELETVATIERDLRSAFVSPVSTGTLRIVAVPGTESFAAGRAVAVDYEIGSRRFDPGDLQTAGVGEGLPGLPGMTAIRRFDDIHPSNDDGNGIYGFFAGAPADSNYQTHLGGAWSAIKTMTRYIVWSSNDSDGISMRQVAEGAPRNSVVVFFVGEHQWIAWYVDSVDRDDATGLIVGTLRTDRDPVVDESGIAGSGDIDTAADVSVLFGFGAAPPAPHFLNPVVEVGVRAVGQTIAGASQYIPPTPEAEFELIDGLVSKTVTVTGTVVAGVVTPRLSGSDADEFEIVPDA